MLSIKLEENEIKREAKKKKLRRMKRDWLD